MSRNQIAGTVLVVVLVCITYGLMLGWTGHHRLAALWTAVLAVFCFALWVLVDVLVNALRK